MAVHDYTIWVDKGNGLAGKWSPPDVNGYSCLKLSMVKPGQAILFSNDDIRIYFFGGADLKRTAETLKHLAYEMEQTLYPSVSMEEALTMGLGVMGS